MLPFPLEMRRDLSLAVNQAAQGCPGRDEDWFAQLSETERACALSELVLNIQQAHPLPDERVAAVTQSGLKPTKTACVLLTSDQPLAVALGKIASLRDTKGQHQAASQ